jgi:hypothetical protein
MNYDPYNNIQTRFHRTDPTGRCNRLQPLEMSKPMVTIVEIVKVVCVGVFVVAVLLAASFLRGM